MRTSLFFYRCFPLTVISDFSSVSGERLPPSQAFLSFLDLLSLSLFHGSGFNSAVSAPREPDRSLSVLELKRDTTKKKKKKRSSKKWISLVGVCGCCCFVAVTSPFFVFLFFIRACLHCWLAVCRRGSSDLLTAVTRLHVATTRLSWRVMLSERHSCNAMGKFLLEKMFSSLGGREEKERNFLW